MRKKRFFQKLYKFDDTCNSYLIEVSLDNYEEIYDDWDPSPFKKRDIEDEFNDFVVNSSEDIPLNYNLCIVLYLPNKVKDEKKEASLKDAYRNFYNYAMARLSTTKANINKKTIFYFLFSILFLTSAYFNIGYSDSIIYNVLKEGIFIGGWVFLWEVFTNIFITMRDINKEYKIYKRLFQAEIRFVYIDNQ